VDPRLRTCVDASLAWYADVFALHGIPTETRDGLWRALGAPPPLHSAAKTLEPGVPERDVLAALTPYDVCSVADSFGDLDLAGVGFSVLIDATWLFHAPLDPAPLPEGWSRVAEPDLAGWVDRHGTPGVFPPAVLAHPAFTVLARDEAGAVVHASEGAVTVAHVFGDVPVAEWLALAAALHPGRPVTDYATGAALEEALDAGFEPVGPQVVWARG
jgi:hypothetical protein